MTQLAEPLPAGQAPAPVPDGPRPGSRAARLLVPRSVDVLKEMAAEYGVCVRPVTMRRTDLTTGVTELIDLPCGATQEAKCPACARRAQRLRRAQIRQGWHRTDEPNPGPEPATETQRSLIRTRAHLEFARAEAVRSADFDQAAECDQAIDEVEQAIAAEGLRGSVAPPHDPPESGEVNPKVRKRSTRRRQDVPNLPRQPVRPTTVGKVYTAPDGREYRPSMWLTLTLDSYGRVHHDGTPVNPGRYDYRRAAWDAVHFARLLDRFWQNLRRAVGWNVQYAGCVEPQRRLAPHAHFAIRGTVPRALLRQVAAATYHQVWWPPTDQQPYTSQHPPVWDGDTDGWCDPDTRTPLPTWDQALDQVDADPDATPAHVIRFGVQVDARGVDAASADIDRTIGYITKYVTKAAADCHPPGTPRQQAHLDRLWAELRVTPCSDRCANWLLYGVQPKNAHARLRPGHCKGKVHQKTTLGIGGRRILVSRDWSGKTLADHRADSRAWVRALLGVTTAQTGPLAEQQAGEQTAPVAWEMARHDDPDIRPLGYRLLQAVSERAQWRAQLLAAKDRAAQDERDVSATPDHRRPTEENLCPTT